MRFAWNGLRESCGYPATLMKLLEAQSVRVNLADPSPCIDWASVVRWDEFGTWPFQHGLHHARGTLLGWKNDQNYHQSFLLKRPEYEQIGQCVVLEDWVCDIREVDGFLTSKSKLSAFSSTDAMVETNSRELIAEVTAAQLAKNLEHREIRILHQSNKTDYFERFLWDGRLFLMNNGGSHHLAAAKYIAARLGERVPLYAKLHSYVLNGRAVASLRADFELFALPDTLEICSPFHEAMHMFGATWLWHPFPRPYAEDVMAVFLPRSAARSMKVADVLRQVGALDLGRYLTELCSRQYAWVHRLRPAGAPSATAP
jgi:hypothetical protein